MSTITVHPRSAGLIAQIEAERYAADKRERERLFAERTGLRRDRNTMRAQELECHAGHDGGAFDWARASEHDRLWRDPEGRYVVTIESYYKVTPPPGWRSVTAPPGVLIHDLRDDPSLVILAPLLNGGSPSAVLRRFMDPDADPATLPRAADEEATALDEATRNVHRALCDEWQDIAATTWVKWFRTRVKIMHEPDSALGKAFAPFGGFDHFHEWDAKRAFTRVMRAIEGRTVDGMTLRRDGEGYRIVRDGERIDGNIDFYYDAIYRDGDSIKSDDDVHGLVCMIAGDWLSPSSVDYLLRQIKARFGCNLTSLRETAKAARRDSRMLYAYLDRAEAREAGARAALHQ